MPLRFAFPCPCPGLTAASALARFATQVMPPFDREMIEPLHTHLRSKGVALHLGDGVAGGIGWCGAPVVVSALSCRSWRRLCGSRAERAAPAPAAAGFEQGPGGKGLIVKTQGGKAHSADLVMLVGSSAEAQQGGGVAGLARAVAADRRWGAWAVLQAARAAQRIAPPAPQHACVRPPQVIGVRPEVALAKAAGLELGPRGGIKVDAHM